MLNSTGERAMNPVNIDVLLGRLRQLPSLPAVVLDVMKTFENEQMDSATLARKIAHDQALAARVLRVANSSFYGLEAQISSIKEAVMVLGSHNVRSIVVSAGIISQFPAAQRSVFDRLAFWRHSLAAAAHARALANRTGHHPETAFTAGLLHDIGRLVLATYFPDEFLGVLEYAAARGCAVIEAEHAVLGLDHTLAGAELARRWKFPSAIQQAVANHHSPDAQPAAPLTDLVYMANVICHCRDGGHLEECLAPLLGAGAFARQGLDWAKLEPCLAEADAQMAGIALIIEG